MVSILLIRQIVLSREINQEQRVLIDSREMISLGSGFETLWQQLAIRIYQASRQDPALAEVLKKEKIGIQPNPAAGTSSAPATTPSAPPASSKTPAGP